MGDIIAMKSILYTASAARQLGSLSPTARERITKKLSRYAASGAGDVTKLAGEDSARIRVGDYRAIFEETEEDVTVVAVGHRRDVCR